MVLETPKGKDLKEDKKNLKVLRRLIKPEARTGRGKKTARPRRPSSRR
jgi:hypothetical protein